MTSGAARTDAPRPIRGALFLVLATLFWSGAAVFAKFLFLGDKFDTVILSQTRTSISFLMLTAWFLFYDRTIFRVQPKDLFRLALIGCVGIGVTNFSYYYTVQASTVATAILIQYTAPAFVTLYGMAIVRQEEPEPIKLISLAVALGGCYVAVTGFEAGVVKISGTILFSGLCSSLGFAFLLIESKRMLERYSNWTMLLYAFGFTAAGWLFINSPRAIAARGYGASDWGTLVLFATVSVLIPYICLSYGLKELSATPVAITMTLEPVLAILFAYIILGEHLSAVQTAGACAVMGAVLLLQINPRSLGSRERMQRAD